MKKILNLRFFGIVIVLVLLSCSPQKTENQTGEMEAADSKTEKTRSDVKVFEDVDPAVRSQINGFLKDYFALNQSLIDDNQAGAKKAAKKFLETIKGFDMSKLKGEQMAFYHAEIAKLDQGLGGITEADEIEKTRTELSNVSESMYSLVKAYHANQSELYYQFCPMAKNGKGANWLSSTKEIVNPYMGQMMPDCGKTEETLH